MASKENNRLRRLTDLAPLPSGARDPVAAVGDFLVRRERALRLDDPVPLDTNAILARATLKLMQNDPDAGELFASVVDQHDVREAWLGLAIAHHYRGETTAAGLALARTLSRHAVATVPPIANSIAQLMWAPGWCALDRFGSVTVELAREPRDRSRLTASIDGRNFVLRRRPDGRRLTGRLSAEWQRARELRVRFDGVDLLGSPIELSRIARVEGFTDSRDGDLQGWAWCPNNPDYDPVLSVTPESGGPGITVLANDPIAIATQSALARPRGFHIPAERLRRFAGLVHVRGSDGRDLTGSPLDPSAQWRSAEAAARIVAGRFPAPGTKIQPMSPEPAFLPVPAHVTGRPIVGGQKRRAVDVIVPVYGELELTLACLSSVLADLPAWARIVVIDDASPDPRVGIELGKLAASGRIILITQATNHGFPRTANIGLSHDAARDVVLLNSDTLVPPGSLAALREAAYAAPDIATATPLSNNATILSYPNREQANALPDLDETIWLHTLARRANNGCLVDIPTAIGFCAYIKRDCLSMTGLLREDLFAQGYGEENDFCLRARHLGWRHVAVPSVFVAHAGGRSFGAARHHLIERNTRMLNQLHPGYDSLIERFRQADPVAEPRRRLDMARWRTFRSRSPSVLLVTHDRRGGVRRHIAERVAALNTEGYRAILLWPLPGRGGDGRDCLLSIGLDGRTPNMRFAIPAELDLMMKVLRADHPVRAEVHHMIGHDHRLLELFQRLNIPYDVIVHDYSWACPRINLVGSGRRYCGEPDIAGCEACIADAGSLNGETISAEALRQRSAIEMAGASSVVVASADVATRLRRYFPSVQLKVTDWENESDLPRADPPAAPDGIRRVCVIGGIGIEKGYDILLACARDISNRKLRLRFLLVGHSCDNARLLATGNVSITGRYEEADAVRLIREQRAQLAWLPSMWPETWCYTLTQAWKAGLNVLAFDIGAQAERIRRSERGWLSSLGSSPQALNDRMLALQPTETDRQVPLFERRSVLVE